MFKARVWGVDKSNVEDQLGALSMLLKLDLRLRAYDAARTLDTGVKGGAATGSGAGAGSNTVPSDVDVDVPTRNDVLTLLADVMEHASKRESEHLNPLFDVLVRVWMSAWCGL